MSSSISSLRSVTAVRALPARRCRAFALPERGRKPNQKEDKSKYEAFITFLREGTKEHDDAVADPGKQLVRVPIVKRIIDKGAEDMKSERKRAGVLRALIRSKVEKHENAIAASGKRARSGMKGIVDRGMKDIKEVASRTQAAPLSEYSDVWTFPVCLVTYSTLVIAWASELAGSTYSSATCGWVGFLLGASFSIAHRACTVRLWKSPSAPLNVVITGGSRGLGRALVREHLRHGDNVYIASRNEKNVREVISELHEHTVRPGQLGGCSCDVSVPSSVTRLASLAKDHFDDRTIDVWINNAGVSGSFKSFLDGEPEDIMRVSRTNLLGALLCTRAAIRAMSDQERTGHVFNMDGAGADGAATPQYAAYGATKAGIAHVMGSVAAECAEAGLPVGVHTLSPGMVLTELILDGATNQNKQVFNILCEQPEVAAAYLVPRARSVAARSDTQTYIRFLTSFKALTKFLSAPFLLGRYFSNDGQRTYDEDEATRLDDKATVRAMSSSRARSGQLQYAFATALCLAVMMLSIDPSTVELDSLQWQMQLPRVGTWVTAALDVPVEVGHLLGR